MEATTFTVLLFLTSGFSLSTAATPFLNEVLLLPQKGGYALDKHYLYLGDYKASVNGKSNVGLVTLYERRGTDIIYPSKYREIKPFDGDSNDHFGFYVIVNKDYLLVASSPDDRTKGSIYIYNKNQDFAYKQKLSSTDADWIMGLPSWDSSNYFNMNDNGDVIMVCPPKAGFAFKYDSASKTWAEAQKLKPRNDAYFWDVFISSKNIVVSNIHNGQNFWEIYVFTLNGTSWEETQIIKITNPGRHFVYYLIGLTEDLIIAGDLENPQLVRLYQADNNGQWAVVKSFRGSGVPSAGQDNYPVRAITGNGILISCGSGFDNLLGRAWVHEYNRTTDEWVERGRLTMKNPEANDRLTHDRGGIMSENLVLLTNKRNGGSLAVFNITEIVSYRPPAVQALPPPAPPPFNSSLSTTPVTECEKDTFNVMWTKSKYPGAQQFDVSLSDVSCNKFWQNATHFRINSTFTRCGSTISEQNSILKQHNTITVRVTYQGNFQRKFIYNLVCQFDRRVNISSSWVNSSMLSVTEVQIVEKNDFQAKLDLYTTSTFLVVAPVPLFVEPPQPLYVDISEQYDLFKLIVDDCFVVSSTNPNTILYSFFLNRCPKDKSFHQLAADPHRFRFRINSFDFIMNERSVMLHCRLFVCHSNDTSLPCQQNCTTKQRKRRDIGDTSTISLLSSEIVFSRQTRCEEMLCGRDNICIDARQPVCVCTDDYIRVDDICTIQQSFKVTGLRISIPSLHYASANLYQAYLDVHSPEFLELSATVKDLLRPQKLPGVQTRARRSSSGVMFAGVISNIKLLNPRASSQDTNVLLLDVIVAYHHHSNVTHAYNEFVELVSRASSTSTVSVVEDSILSLVEKDKGEEAVNLLFLLGIFIPLLLILMAIVCYFQIRRIKLRNKVTQGEVSNNQS